MYKIVLHLMLIFLKVKRNVFCFGIAIQMHLRQKKKKDIVLPKPLAMCIDLISHFL